MSPERTKSQPAHLRKVIEVTGTKSTIITHCSACDKKFKPYCEVDFDPATEQLDNALEIEFSGGYSMFVDLVFDQPEGVCRVMICHECAHELCDKIPWINKLLDPHNSHAHGYDRDWTGH